jgi:hypothetical protein
MRNRILFSDYSTELTDKGWSHSVQRGCKCVFTPDGQAQVITVCRDGRGDLFVTHVEQFSAVGQAAD